MQARNATRRASGFTILEMSVVLVVIALLLGAVSVGRDVYRSAMAERIGSEFVQGWIIAYDRYVAQVGTVPGDDLANPTGRVVSSGAPPGLQGLCRQDLRDAMLERGITLPRGRAEGHETRYAYQDSNGLPQELEICFLNVSDWAEPGTGNSYVHRRRNVMVLYGMTPELANQLDTRIDGAVDARFGRLREATVGAPANALYNTTSPVNTSTPEEHPWSRTGIDRLNSGNDDTQVAVVTGYLKMNQ